MPNRHPVDDDATAACVLPEWVRHRCHDGEAWHSCRMSHGWLGEFANQLMADHGFARVAAVTARTTGNPALETLDLRTPQFFVSVQYEARPDHESQSVTELVSALGLTGSLDLVVADPHHTYESSEAALAVSLDLLRPGGVMLVHDCLPPPELTAPQFQPGNWCGVTYAAFKDLCVARGLPWCTIDWDFGIGVVVQGETPGRAAIGAASRDLAVTRKKFEADPYGFMCAVPLANAGRAVRRLRNAQTISDLRGKTPPEE